MKKIIIILSIFCIIFSISAGENSKLNKKNKKLLKLKNLQKRAENGDPKAQMNMGKIYSIRKKYKKAISWYKKAANQNNAEAQYKLGTIYLEKINNKTKAKKWITKALKNPDASGKIKKSARKYLKNHNLNNH